MSNSWVDWESLYQHCNALMCQGEGIFCANFGVTVIGFPLFHLAWCKPFYQQKPGTSFLVYQLFQMDTIPRPDEDQLYFQDRPCHSVFYPLSVMSVHFTTSQVIQTSTKIVLIKMFLIIYSDPIWMHLGITRKGHCITLPTCFPKRLQRAKIWAFKCFQHHQVPFQLIIMGEC